MHGSCMATKTISLEIDAYEKLKASKRPGESFSNVVRRAMFPECSPTGANLLDWMSREGPRATDAYLDAVEEANASDTPPKDPWS